MKGLPKVYSVVTPERFCEVANELINFIDENGSPAKLTPELATRILGCPEFLKHLPQLPPDAIIGGFDS